MSNIWATYGEHKVNFWETSFYHCTKIIKINHRDTEIAQRYTEVIAHLFYEATYMSLRGTKITERSELGEANPVPFSFMTGGRPQWFDFKKITPSRSCDFRRLYCTIGDCLYR